MKHQMNRMTLRRVCRANFAFTYAMRFFAYRYFYRFYFFYSEMKQNAQRALAA